MSQRTSGEPIGCLALLVGGAALAFVLTTSPAGRRLLGSAAPGATPATSSPTAAAELEAPRKALEAEAERLRDEARRLRDERMSARKERLLSLAARYENGERRQYRKLRLHNTCRYLVAVALHYRDLDDSWVTRGWWEVAPGTSITADAMTRDSVFYLYAENQSVGRVWDGKSGEGSVSLEISDDKFDQLQGEPFVFRSPRTVSFARRSAGPEWTDPVETFECPVEEAPPAGSVAKPPSAAQGPRRP